MELRHFFNFTEKGLGMLYSYYLPDPSKPSNLGNLDPRIVSFFNKNIDRLNAYKTTLIDLYLKMPAPTRKNLDVNALIASKKVSPETVIAQYAHDYKLKSVESRILNPYSKKAIQYYAKETFRKRGIETLGFNSLKKLKPPKIENIRRALTVYANRSDQADFSVKTTKAKSMFTDIDNLQKTFEDDGLWPDFLKAIIVYDAKEAQKQLATSSSRHK